MAIKIILFKAFIANPGPDNFEWHNRLGVTNLEENMAFFKDIKCYPLFLSNMGFIWIPVLLYFHLIKNEFVKRSVLVIFPFFIGMMLVGTIYELRIYGELIPVFLMALFLIGTELMRSRSETLMYLCQNMRT